MKQLILIIFIYFSFGVTNFDERPFVSDANFNVTIPNTKAMEKEVIKMNKAVVATSILNKEINTAITTLDSLNDALSTPKDIRKYKRESRKLKN